MTEELNWMSARRRSSAAFRTNRFESDGANPNLLAKSDRSIAVDVSVD